MAAKTDPVEDRESRTRQLMTSTPGAQDLGGSEMRDRCPPTRHHTEFRNILHGEEADIINGRVCPVLDQAPDTYINRPVGRGPDRV